MKLEPPQLVTRQFSMLASRVTSIKRESKKLSIIHMRRQLRIDSVQSLAFVHGGTVDRRSGINMEKYRPRKASVRVRRSAKHSASPYNVVRSCPRLSDLCISEFKNSVLVIVALLIGVLLYVELQVSYHSILIKCLEHPTHSFQHSVLISLPSVRLID